MYLERVAQLNPDLVEQALLTPDKVVRGRIIAKFMELDEAWLESYLQDKLQDGYVIDEILAQANSAVAARNKKEDKYENEKYYRRLCRDCNDGVFAAGK